MGGFGFSLTPLGSVALLPVADPLFPHKPPARDRAILFGRRLRKEPWMENVPGRQSLPTPAGSLSHCFHGPR